MTKEIITLPAVCHLGQQITIHAKKDQAIIIEYPKSLIIHCDNKTFRLEEITNE